MLCKPVFGVGPRDVYHRRRCFRPQIERGSMTGFIDSRDLDAIVTIRPNVLVCGDRQITDAFLSALPSHYSSQLRELPIASLKARGDLSEGTAVLRDVADYSEADQQNLLAWLDRRGRSTQLIATTDRPLLDLVSAGQFDARLFYRLNMVYLDLNSQVLPNA
jgi:hypothetical protein